MNNLKSRIVRLEEKAGSGRHVVLSDDEHVEADVAAYLAAHPGVTEVTVVLSSVPDPD